MKKLFGEFKDFIARGNVMDMAIGVIIGGAFMAIVNSLVNDIINPFIKLISGGGTEVSGFPSPLQALNMASTLAHLSLQSLTF